MVVVPSEHASTAHDIVVEELTGAGLQVNASKTVVWTKDPTTPLPGPLQHLRRDRLRVLGAASPSWMDEEEALAQLPLHSQADGEEAVREAVHFTARLAELRVAGLGAKEYFLLLQSYSQGCVTHLLRANLKEGAWTAQLDEVFIQALEALIAKRLGPEQKEQAFMRLSGGGLGLGSAESIVSAAYLGSWALTLKGVAECLGETSWHGFRAACQPVAESIDRAEAHLEQVGEGRLDKPDWMAFLSESKPKMQGHWSGKLRERRRERLLARLGTDDRVDLRSAGGPGAGGFLEPPVVREGEAPATMPDQHFIVALLDRLRLPVCPPGARCQHRKEEGGLCNQVLDPRGKHAVKCPCGPTRVARHDGVRDFCAGYHKRVTGLVAVKEQRVVAWDRVNPRTGVVEEARLDVATRDPTSGLPIFIDATITCAHSGSQPRQQARANKDGLAAANAADDKRDRYPPAGGDLVPLAFEAAGRPGDETIKFVRSWGHGLDAGERSEVIRYAWQQFSVILQTGNAEMILSALG